MLIPGRRRSCLCDQKQTGRVLCYLRDLEIEWIFKTAHKSFSWVKVNIFSKPGSLSKSRRDPCSLASCFQHAAHTAIPSLKDETDGLEHGTNRQRCQDDRSDCGIEHIPFCQPGDASSLVPDPGLLQKCLQKLSSYFKSPNRNCTSAYRAMWTKWHSLNVALFWLVW